MRQQCVPRRLFALLVHRPQLGMLAAVLLAAAPAGAQVPRVMGTMTTVAGGGSVATSASDGGAATGAILRWPTNIAMDSLGNLYFSDQGHYVVRKVTPGGVISTVAGTWTPGTGGDGGAATSAQLNAPSGVAVDSSNNLYISDENGHTIRKVTASTGVISTFASGGDYLPDFSPMGMAFDSSGTLWVALDGSSCILAIASNGTQTGHCGGFRNPRGLAIDSSGYIYVASFYGNQVQKYNPSTKTMTLVAGSGYIGSDGGGDFSGDGGQATSARLNGPSGVAVDSQGNIFISDMRNCRVRMVDAATGVIQTVAGTGDAPYNGDNVGARNLSIYYPDGLLTAPNGDLYIADLYHYRVRRVAASTDFGSTTVGSASAPHSLDFYFRSATTVGSYKVLVDGAVSTEFQVYTLGTDCSARTYSADAGCRLNFTFNPRTAGLRRGTVAMYDGAGTAIATVNVYGTGVAPVIAFQPAVVSVVAGTGSQCGSSDGSNCGDGGAATSATFGDPSGVAADGAGNLLITDRGTNRVRKVNAATGVITTAAGTGGLSSTGDGGPATSATLYTPWGVAFDGMGNYFISDVYDLSPYYSRVRRVDAITGTIATVAGNGTRCSSSTAMCGDSGEATSANLWLPRGLAVDTEGGLYIGDERTNRIRKVTGGTIATVAGTGISGSGGNGGQATSAQFSHPVGLTRDSAGNLYIADSYNNQVRKITKSTGLASVVAGTGGVGSTGDGGAATSALLFLPTDVAVDAAENVFIADAGNGRVRMVAAATGLISTVVSGLSNPTGLALDGSGSLYVVDAGHYRVLKVAFQSPLALTFASTNMLATSAAQDVTVRNAGNAALETSSITVPADFSLGGEDSSCSSRTNTLESGESCILGVVFHPQTSGAISDNIVLTDNHLYGSSATQSIAVSGTAVQEASKLVFGSTIPAVLTSGSTLGIVTVNVADSNGGVVSSSNAAVTLALSGPVGFTTRTLTQTAASGVASFDLSAYPLTVAGSYTVTATSASLSGVSASVLLPAAPTLKVVCTEAIYDGTTHSCTGSAVGTDGTTAVLGSWTFSPANATAAGSYPVTGTFTSTDSNYTGGTATGTLKIDGATPTLKLTCAAVTYDGTAHGCTGSATGVGRVAVSGSWGYSPASATAAGSYPVTGTFTSTDSNYVGGTASGTLTINRAALQAKADTKTMTMGGSVPALTYTIGGFVGGDTAAVVSGTPVLTTTATSSSAAGSYRIVVAPGTLNSVNYSFTPVNGTLTVAAGVSVKLTVTSTITKAAAGQYTAAVTITNSGTSTASAVTLTSAKLGGIAGAFTSSPVTLQAGASTTVTAQFTSSTLSSGAAAVQIYGGTYTGGTFSVSSRVTLP
jgi:sugar lactone lactonase YvrE